METKKKRQDERKAFFGFRLLFLLLLGVICVPGVFAGCSGAERAASDVGYASDGASKTNVQEEGVDEADIVKVNAEGYIFKAQRDGITVSRLNQADGTLAVISQSAYTGFAPTKCFFIGINI